MNIERSSENVPDHPNVLSEKELDWGESSYGKKFGYRRKSLSLATGGQKLGCSLYEVRPGRRAWPFHYHVANEEGIRGRVRAALERLSASRPYLVVRLNGSYPDASEIGYRPRSESL